MTNLFMQTKRQVKIKNKNKSSLKTRKGFSLLETLIAVSLFSLLTVMVSGVFASFLKSYAESKKTLQDVEEVQFAMNLMAKTIRTSDVKLESANVLKVYDYSQSKCLKYSFASNKMQVNYSSETGQGEVDKCVFAAASMSGLQDLTTANVTSASFKVVPSTSATLGFVNVALTVEEVTQTTAPMKIQKP